MDNTRVFHCLKCKNAFSCYVAVSCPTYYECTDCKVRLEIKLVDKDLNIYQIKELVIIPNWEC